MFKNLVLLPILFITAIFFLLSPVYSQVPSSQTGGGVEQQEREIEKEKRLREKIEKPRVVPEIDEEIVPSKERPLSEDEKVLIKEIIVEGASLVSAGEIEEVISIFKNTELTLKDMQKVADLITDLYRQKGYLTSRAYLPPQKIKDGRLLIRVVEAEIGSIQIKGNRYFKTKLLERKIGLTEGESFNYKDLQKSLTLINEHPDREAKVVLLPGEEPGTTNIAVEVKDNLPIHLGFEYDNYASRYIKKDRWSAILEHNNLLGFDDKLYLKYQLGESSLYQLMMARYIFPLTNTMEIGGYFSRNRTKLAEEFENLEVIGKTKLYGLFINKSLITEQDIDLRLNLGFDYKRIRNYLLGTESSRDDLRVFKGGFDLDMSDKWGRTIFTSELDVGVPDIFGGSPSKNPSSSRAGAGGKFYKGVFNVFRLQPMPFSSSLLWKNSGQYSNYNLAASEQFQIGGATSVRGYPPAEHAGDKGIYTSMEWSFPPYFTSKNLNVPFTKEKIYDSTRFVLFYDWATTHVNNVLSGEKNIGL